MPRIGVILSGCGFLDGAEITESVLTLHALDRAGADVVCMAPDIAQRKVVNHLNGEETQESRNVLVEAARIARGKVENIADVDAGTLDAVVMPGGFGAALNLSSFGVEGAAGSIHEDVARVLKEVHAAKKPVGAICIAPSLVALALGDDRPMVTIGNDPSTAAELEKLGVQHKDCVVEGSVTDEQKKIVTCPAYMYDASIKDVARGIDSLVDEVIRLCT